MQRISDAISWLEQAGIHACEAQTGSLPEVTSPIAAVGLQESQVPGKIHLAVTVLCHSSLGGTVCSDSAVEAAQVLSRHGAACHVGPVRFDGEAGLFSVAVTAVFPVFMPVKVGGIPIGHVTDFTATWVEEDGLWYFRMEERFSLEEAEETKPREPFSIICRHDAYHNCRLSERTRTLDSGGLTQVTKGYSTKLSYI